MNAIFSTSPAINQSYQEPTKLSTTHFIRAFRLGRKELLFFLCFIIFLFLDTLRSTILRKPEEALKICLHHLRDHFVQREK